MSPASAADRTRWACSIRSSTIPASRWWASKRRKLGIETGKHAASLNGGAPGVLHGNRTYLLQTDDGQILDAHSISAGLDYPGIGPEHAWLHDLRRIEYVPVSDREALDAFRLLTRLEGIIPALESAHAIAEAMKRAPHLPPAHLMVINLSGRGDKDLDTVAKAMGA